MKVFVIDPDKCVGCYSCQIVCKDEHCDNDWSPYAKPQPDTGHFWMRVNEKERGQTPKVRVSYVAQPCMHCENAACLEACPLQAIKRRDDGLLVIDPALCDGCMQCAKACAYGSIYKNDELNIAQKCTGCAHLLDDGWTVPRCVDACAHDALRFGEEADFAEELTESQELLPELGSLPRVRYLNLPKRFIAGEIADLEADECLQGALVVLTNLATGAQLTTQSDEFGDFWFKQIDAAEYSIDVALGGYLPRTVRDFITTVDKDLNVGTIALYRA
jgi:Fe-S-cluster-containing dehydrogenase component